jgi:cytoplasmic iron level regulating protein YaaA (DUF328/UPF0246 family)
LLTSSKNLININDFYPVLWYGDPMKILLAPSETKRQGGTEQFDPCTLLFEELCPARMQLLHRYTNILQRGNSETLRAMFGLKKPDDIAYHASKDLIHEPTMRAIMRYTGVAFDYLDYAQLDTDAKAYLDDHLLIFSNFFGILRASDAIPEYRLQQNKPIDDIKPDQFYRPLLQPLLDAYLEDQEILDIRAGFYDKYYKPTQPYTTLKFLKDGKVVSHWAKAYRGIVLREIAKAQIATLEDFLALPIEGLQIEEIQTKGVKTEVVYGIVS